MQRLEIARIDNDPSRPDRGIFELDAGRRAMSDTDTTPCGCCDGIARETPLPIWNRPGLSQIAYRVGTHAQLQGEPARRACRIRPIPALAPLTTRDDSDFSIALLDAFAVSADILTFYQERLANESYLRTAVQPRSVFELARLVGYSRRPASPPRRRWRSR